MLARQRRLADFGQRRRGRDRFRVDLEVNDRRKAGLFGGAERGREVGGVLHLHPEATERPDGRRTLPAVGRGRDRLCHLGFDPNRITQSWIVHFTRQKSIHFQALQHRAGASTASKPDARICGCGLFLV